MSMRKRFAIIAAAFVMLLGCGAKVGNAATGSTTGTAIDNQWSPGTNPTVSSTVAASCASFSFCLWDGKNFTGAQITVHVSIFNGTGCYNLGGVGFSNRAESGMNNTGLTVRFRDSATCSGTWYQMQTGTWQPDFGSYNNRISGVNLA